MKSAVYKATIKWMSFEPVIRLTFQHTIAQTIFFFYSLLPLFLHIEFFLPFLGRHSWKKIAVLYLKQPRISKSLSQSWNPRRSAIATSRGKMENRLYRCSKKELKFKSAFEVPVVVIFRKTVHAMIWDLPSRK